MNKRIQELANKAGAEVKIIHGDILYISKADLDIEKFAELIVGECMKLNHEHFNDEDPYSIDSLYRQHFGFKE